MSGVQHITRFFEAATQAEEGTMGLTLLLGPDSFIYAIYNLKTGVVNELCDEEFSHAVQGSGNYEDQLRFMLANHQLTQKQFKKVTVGLLNKDFTLLPQAFFNNNSKDYLEFTTGNKQIKQTFTHQLGNACFCYTASQELFAILEKTFPSAVIRHCGAVNIWMLLNQKGLLASNLFMNLTGNYVELCGSRDKDLLFYNVFNYSNNEDVLYYLLFMMEQFNIKPQEARLVFAGQRQVNDELLNHVKKYIREVNFSIHTAKFNGLNNLAQLPMHYYFTLLMQAQCEL